jgi:DNA-binding NarL/FixJ family response regulator
MAVHTRILIADDHELVRRGLAELLNRTPGWKVVAEAADGNEAVALAAAEKPDLIVLDLTMPRLNGIGAARKILESNRDARILILTAHESEQLVREVLASGALGYVLKSDTAHALTAALRELLAGRPFFSSSIGRMVLDGYLRAGGEEQGGAGVLSGREREIVQLLAEGRSNKEVARALGISVATAETHRSNIMRKIGAGSLAELVRFAIRNKIIEP